MSEASTYIPIADINNQTRVNVIGEVIYSSGIEHWKNNTDSGHKMVFDIADVTGEIRVFVWQDVDGVDELIRRGQIVELNSVCVTKEPKQYNNVDHPFSLKLETVQQIKVRGTKKEENFATYDQVRSEEYSENTYFDVIGQIVKIGGLQDGYGEYKGRNDTLRKIDIKDDEGNVLRVGSWNEYIPLDKLAVGKLLRVNKGKYVRKHDELKSSGAQITIDGERII